MLASVALSQEKLIPGWLQPVVMLDLLAARGIDPASVLRGTALFIEDSPFTRHYLNPQHFDRLLANAHRQWPGEDFCFQLGHQLAEEGAGPLREVLAEPQPLSHWLTVLQQYQLLAMPSLGSRLYAAGRKDYFLLFNGQVSADHSGLALRCVLSLLTHWLKRSNLQLQVEVFLREKTPADVALFHTHVSARCHFSAPFDGLRLQVMHQETSQYQPSLRTQVAMQQCAQLCGQRGYLLAELFSMLWEVGTEPLSLQLCAERLQTSPATLKRRLKELNCNFQQLLDQMRSQRAVIELLMTGTSVEQVGARLHFHDSSNFRRAFKRWTGMTPSTLKAAYKDVFQSLA